MREKRVDEWKKVLVIPIKLNDAVKEVFPKDFKIVSKSNCTIGKMVKSPNNTLIKKDTGIYVIGCDECEKVYVGESDNFTRRRYQHSRSLIFDDINSSLVQHNGRGHHVNLDKSEIIYNTCNVNVRTGLESFLIKNSNNFNLKSGELKIDYISNKLLKQLNICKKIIYKYNLCLSGWAQVGD